MSNTKLINKKILNKIQSGKVKMKPRWKFEVIKWSEVGLWIVMMGLAVVGAMGIGYFLMIYNLVELSEFDDLGWQIFYEDFPYTMATLALVCLITGTAVFIKTGRNYKHTWQKNMFITVGMILTLVVIALFLGF